MSSINSPIGNKNFSPSVTHRASTQRTYEVPDNSGQDNDLNEEYGQSRADYAAMEREIAAARKEKVTGKVKITPYNKQRVEFLANIGRITKEVRIENTTFTLRTLKSKEMRSCIAESLQQDVIQQTFELRRQQLATSLCAIDGNDLFTALETNDRSAVMDILDEFDESLIERLYSEFASLTREASDRFKVSSETDLKELAEEIKK